MLDIVPSPYPKFRPGSMWNDRFVDLLCERWEQGVSASRIAIELGEPFTKNAVIGKVHRLGLEIRKTGFKPGQERARPTSSNKPRYTEQDRAAMESAKNAEIQGAREMRKNGETYGNIGRKFGYSDQWAYMHTRDLVVSFPRLKAKSHLKSIPGTPTPPYVPKVAAFDLTPGANPVKLLDHKEGQCRWPLGEVLSEEFRYCGNPCAERSSGARLSYCGHHYGMAYVTVPV